MTNEQILEVAEPLLKAAARKHLRRLTREDREDAMQDVRLSIFRRSGQYDPERGELRCWLKVCIRHAMIDYLRRQQRTTEAPLDVDPVADADTAGAEALTESIIANPESYLTATKAHLLRQMFATHSRDELARLLGVSRDIADQRICRLRRDVEVLLARSA